MLALVSTHIPFALVAFGAELRIGVFCVDASPPTGSPLCFGLAPPCAGINDPLTARGIVLAPGGEPPIVLTAVDWTGIGNGSQDAWRQAIADACDTEPSRVVVHTLHQHDAPACDLSADAIAATAGLEGRLMDRSFSLRTIQTVADAAKRAAAEASPVTHVGHAAAIIERVASNRRLLGPDGKVAYQRMSSCTNQKIRDMPEGIIDAKVRLVSFWRDERPLAVLTYYATHPQSYYRTGKASADFVGLARDALERSLEGARVIHFNGAAGNVAAGKYNDGAPQRRQELADRLAAGLQAAWANTAKISLNQIECAWETAEVLLPTAPSLDEGQLKQVLADQGASDIERLQAARGLAFLQRCRAGRTITISRLRIGGVDLVHLPGEPFVEYQLAAQSLTPDRFVCVAGYGDVGPGYIGLTQSYREGGYETGAVSRVAPQVEQVLLGTLQRLSTPDP